MAETVLKHSKTFFDSDGHYEYRCYSFNRKEHALQTFSEIAKDLSKGKDLTSTQLSQLGLRSNWTFAMNFRDRNLSFVVQRVIKRKKKTKDIIEFQ